MQLSKLELNHCCSAEIGLFGLELCVHIGLSVLVMQGPCLLHAPPLLLLLPQLRTCLTRTANCCGQVLSGSTR